MPIPPITGVIAANQVELAQTGGVAVDGGIIGVVFKIAGVARGARDLPEIGADTTGEGLKRIARSLSGFKFALRSLFTALAEDLIAC